MVKPNCYECKWRGSVPGDAHSCCNHPLVSDERKDHLTNMFAMFANVGRINPIQPKINKLNIRADDYGVKSGWFNFPWNFDPTWLISCDGFDKIERGETKCLKE